MEDTKATNIKTLVMAMGFVVAFTGATMAQGTVKFANSATTTPIYINDGSTMPVYLMPKSGVEAYTFGLWVGPAGCRIDELVMQAQTSPNSSVTAGAIKSINPFTVTGYTAGTTIAFQVRGWAGSSWPTATTVGCSDIGYVTLGGGTALPGDLFGTKPGNVSGFTIGIPEPTSAALAGLGLMGFLIFHRRK